MEYRKLGRSGVQVSSLCVGTMTWGGKTDEDEAGRIYDHAVEAGVNFFDTANAYTRGVSEEMLGRIVQRKGNRDEVFLATKYTANMGSGVNSGGSSRYHMMQTCDASLKRMQTDRIDLFYVHFMDMTTPVDESLRGIDDLIAAGKIRYIGTSKWVPSLITEAILTSTHYGWNRFVAEQPPYNLLDRSIEKELVWTALRHGVGLVPWAPLATGMLSGKYDSAESPPEGSRGDKGGIAKGRLNDPAIDRANALKPLAEAKGMSLAEFALAWIHQQPGITAPILGARTLGHLESALKGIETKLTADELDQVDEIAPPGSAVSNYWDQNTFQKLRPEMLQHRRVG